MPGDNEKARVHKLSLKGWSRIHEIGDICRELTSTQGSSKLVAEFVYFKMSI